MELKTIQNGFISSLKHVNVTFASPAKCHQIGINVLTQVWSREENVIVVHGVKMWIKTHSTSLEGWAIIFRFSVLLTSVLL